MDASTWEVLKALINWAVVPLVGAIMYFVKKNITRIEIVEQEVREQKTRTAVIESKVDDIRDDLKEIKRNVEKLVDRVPQ